jgi:glycosyltransferase involved in cell wall biosynthesis
VLSFIIPAHNEEALIGDTLGFLRASAGQLGELYEIIVVDDASTDRTAAVAISGGASVVRIDRRQIAASRNAGAKAARGDVLIFVDADTRVPVATLRSSLAAIEAGAVGGGARFVVEPGAPRWLAWAAVFTAAMMRVLHWAAGCFIFARRDAFESVGGFDERYYATEEIVLSRALKKLGRTVIVKEPVVTSARKARLYDLPHVMRLMFRLMTGGRRALRRREGLELWYDGRRE